MSRIIYRDNQLGRQRCIVYLLIGLGCDPRFPTLVVEGPLDKRKSGCRKSQITIKSRTLYGVFM